MHPLCCSSDSVIIRSNRNFKKRNKKRQDSLQRLLADDGLVNGKHSRVLSRRLKVLCCRDITSPQRGWKVQDGVQFHHPYRCCCLRDARVKLDNTSSLGIFYIFLYIFNKYHEKTKTNHDPTNKYCLFIQSEIHLFLVALGDVPSVPLTVAVQNLKVPP